MLLRFWCFREDLSQHVDIDADCTVSDLFMTLSMLHPLINQPMILSANLI